MGKQVDYFSDDEEQVYMDDVIYEEELFEYKMQKNSMMQNRTIDSHMRRNLKNDSRVDYSTFSSFNNDGSESVNDKQIKIAPYIRNNQYNHLNKY
jgi:hypothetical protein